MNILQSHNSFLSNLVKNMWDECGGGDWKGGGVGTQDVSAVGQGMAAG